MTATQKFAWFNLLVVLGVLLIVGCLYPFFGWKAHGALGLTALLALSPIFYRKRENEVITDERDALIQRRAALIGASVFWLVYVLASSLLTPLVYGQEGCVPVEVVQVSVFYALVLFIGVVSVATLILNSRG
ncbi:hypothetical protein Pan241w_00740 [Gimesia alba]|uniref:Uncharacterized protein n=1 Tax=Gimesia alba TaxID=2527973 RepID=A0A517R864_9PLAN|nr:DUF2178 domain-containing protein [Gimesia alba]QDT40021.1 hypothetical protein Pan241w_00740 [Gimesia alba]